MIDNGKHTASENAQKLVTLALSDPRSLVHFFLRLRIALIWSNVGLVLVLHG
jgi:hypothetical protein